MFKFYSQRAEVLGFTTDLAGNHANVAEVRLPACLLWPSHILYLGTFLFVLFFLQSASGQPALPLIPLPISVINQTHPLLMKYPLISIPMPSFSKTLW